MCVYIYIHIYVFRGKVWTRLCAKKEDAAPNARRQNLCSGPRRLTSPCALRCLRADLCVRQ